MLNRRAFLGTLAGGALSTAEPRPRPNVIFLLLDDLGWKDFGSYGQTFYQTPHLDRLASEGIRFTNAYASCPVCSPTRASIMTGRYPSRTGITDWIPGRKQWPTAKLLTPPNTLQLSLDEVSLAEALQPAGYRSASVGKWHLGGEGYGPEQQGFHLNVGGTHRGSPASYFGPFDLPNLTGGGKDDYLTEFLTDASEKFIERAAPQGPFFLYLSEFTVHTPLQARQQAIRKYQAQLAAGQTFPNPVYAAMVESVDDTVGRLRRTLSRLGIADNTVLIVTSDNGGLRFEGKSPNPVTDNSPLRAGKGHLYEGGIRVPLLVYWPRVTKARSVSDFPVSSIDFLPTILDMAGARLPRGPIDGVSLVGLLRDGRTPKRDALYWHYPHYSNQGGVPGGAVRSGDYKLIEFYEDNRLELYNLREDPGETRNLALGEPRRASRLRAMLDRWRKSTGAVMPKPNPGYDPEKADQGLTGVESPTAPVRSP